MEKLKKANIWKIIWLVGVYVILLFILYLVIIYKVRWEDKDLNRYLYFYNCNGNLCTADMKVNKYYGSVVCPDRKCPYIKDKRDDVIILSDEDKEYVFNYRESRVINDKYNTYSFASEDGYFIVSDDSNMYGVIDSEGNPVIDVSYELITDYNNGFVAYTSGEKHGIDNKEKDITIDPKYDDTLLINDTYFAYAKNDEYFIASYASKESDDPYSYIYVYNGAILAVKNGHIDLLDENLNSTLAAPMECYFPYTTEQERATLRISAHDNVLEFSIKDEEQKYNDYVYHTKGKILFGQ